MNAFNCEFDFDSPEAIDFDVLVNVLRDLKLGYDDTFPLQEWKALLLTVARKRADVPIYSFERHQREERTLPIYSPHVLILEGIFALYDQRVLEMLDLKIFADADADLCLSRRSMSLIMLAAMYANKRSNPRCSRSRARHRGLHQAVVQLCEAELPALCRAATSASRYEVSKFE